METDTQREGNYTLLHPISSQQHIGICPTDRSRKQDEGVLPHIGSTSGGPQSICPEGWTEDRPSTRNDCTTCEKSDTDVEIRTINHRVPILVSINSGGHEDDNIGNGDKSELRATTSDEGETTTTKYIRHALTTRCRRATVKIASINIRNFSDAKALKIRRILEKHDTHLAIITETNTKLNRPLLGQGRPLMVIGDTDANSGVAILFESNKIKTVDVTKPRIVEATLLNDIHIIGCYGPTEQAPTFEKIQFWGTMKTTVEKSINTYHSTVIVGDMNAGHETIRGIKKSLEETNYQRLLAMIGNYEISILPTPPTWKSARSNHPTRTLDRCLVQSNGTYDANAKLDWESSISDHAVLLASITFDSIDRNKGRPYSKCQLNTVDPIDTLWLQTKKRLKQLPRQPNTNLPGPIHQFWKMYNEEKNMEKLPLIILDTDGNELAPKDAVEACATYLKTVWNKAEPYTIKFYTNHKNSSPPSIDEVTRATMQLKKDAAVGRDKIPPMLVRGNTTAIQEYTNFFKALWGAPLTFPTEWKDMKVRPIFKKESRTLPIGARPITCLSTSAKILNKIISERNSVLYENVMHNDVHSYRCSRSTWTAITSLTSEIVKHGRCVVTFLDMSKAFDCVSRKAFERAINRWGLPQNEAHMIIAQYTNAQVHVELNGEVATPFLHTNGIRQGCTLSGIFWNLITSEMHFNLDKIFPQSKHKILSYADDIIIITTTKIEGQIIKKVLRDELDSVGLKLNDEKEVIREFDTNGSDTTFVEWLGVAFTTNLTWDVEVEHRIKRATAATENIRQIRKKNSLLLPTEIMIQILRSLVGTHFTSGMSAIHFTQHHRLQMSNCMMEAILLHTNISANLAESVANAIIENTKMPDSLPQVIDPAVPFNDVDEILEEDVATDSSTNLDEHEAVEPDHSKHDETTNGTQHTKTRTMRFRMPTQTGNGLCSAPTNPQLWERQQIIRDLREERSWCHLCNPPYQIRNITAMNKHRHEKHGIGPQGPLQVKCNTCQRTMESTRFSRHVCIDLENTTTNLVKCRHCSRNYSKFGIAQHENKCPERL